MTPKSWIYLSRQQYRRRIVALCVAAGALVVLSLVVVGSWASGQPPTPGRVTIYDAKTGDRLWSRTTPGGYVVVLAVTPGGALVADADDCNHGGAGRVALLTPKTTTVVGSTSGCAVYHFTGTDGVATRRVSGGAPTLIVTVPAQLLPLRTTMAMPCPCPASPPGPNGNPGSPVGFGATAKVQLGKFTLGGD